MPSEPISVSVRLRDIDGMAFDAHLPTGQTILFDAGDDHGGQNLGPRPMHAILAALAGCTGMDVISFLRKMRQPVEGYEVRVEGVRRDEDPKIYTHIKVRHIITGDVKEDRLARAIQLSDETYCSVGAMLRAAAEVTTEWEIVRP